MTQAPSSTRQPAPEDPARLAARFGLTEVGGRPGFGHYLVELAQRRHFVLEMARAQARSASSSHRLGQLWSVLNPLMLAGVYYLAFGLILGARGDSSNFELFLIAGVFTFTFITACINAGSGAIVKNRGLIRSVQFPRAVLPVAVVGKEVLQLGPKIGVLLVVALLTGEPLSVRWLQVLPALGLAALFATGAAFLAARAVAHVRDLGNVLPYVIRAWMYLSGIFYSINDRLADAPAAIRSVAQVNPAHVYIELVRGAFLPAEHPATPGLWGLAAAWALGVLLVGVVLFWQAEERYGRE